VITTETGEQPVADNGPLRGGKSQLFEGGVRVPFALRWPRRIAGGGEYQRPISAMDITGTIAGQLGISISPQRPLDGVDLIPYLAGEKKGDPQPVLFWRKFDQGQHAMVVGDLKYVFNGQYGALFNLRTDEAEKRNIGPTNKENMAQLEKLYQVWNAQMAPKPAFPPLGTWPRPSAARKQEQAQ